MRILLKSILVEKEFFSGLDDVMAPQGSTCRPPLPPRHSKSSPCSGISPPRAGTQNGVSWANVVGSEPNLDSFVLQPHLNKAYFDKVKNHSVASVTIDKDLWLQAKASMQSSLYAKFLGKALPLDQAKLALTDAWRGLGNFTVADLPNGFYYIRCENQEMQNRLL